MGRDGEKGQRWSISGCIMSIFYFNLGLLKKIEIVVKEAYLYTTVNSDTFICSQPVQSAALCGVARCYAT